MASLPLLRGSARLLQVLAARQQSHPSTGGGSAAVSAITSSWHSLDCRFPEVHGGTIRARGRCHGDRCSEVRSHPRFVASGSSKSNKASTQKQKQPSILEVQRAIGVIDNNEPDNKMQSGGPSSFLDILASTPIGQAESSIERKIRETAEWLVEHTESQALHGQKIILIVCMMIFPVWVFLLAVASGLVQLPFKSTFLDNLLS